MKSRKGWKNSNNSSEPRNGRSKVVWIHKDSVDRNSKVVRMIH